MTNPLYDGLFGFNAQNDSPFLRLQDGSMITYKDFLAMASRMANAMTQIGLKAGDRVAAQVAKSPEALALYAACVQAGLIFLPLNTAYTVNEVTYFIEDSGAQLIVCDSATAAPLQPLAISNGSRIETMNANGSGSLLDAASAMPSTFPTVARHGDDLAALLYTSGTTGRSKGAMLTQTNLLSNARTLAREWRFTSDDVLLHALPIFHTHGLFVATNVSAIVGGSMIFLPKFDLEQLVDLMPLATVMMGVPTFYTRLLDHPHFGRDLTAKMRLFVSGSAPLLAETHSKFETRTGHRILERYGMTETNMITSNPYEGDRRAGSVGLPLPEVDVRITDPDTNNPVQPGEVGQIEVRGPNVFKGYWQMPEKTAAELLPDGFFITGDLGQVDSDGYIQIVGRNKDLIISGGFNIYPKEIELVLDEQPGVLESAVVGVPHSDFGEAVLGLIVAQKGCAPDLDEISKAAGVSLARFKKPQKLILIDELPRNTMGKVQKNILRETYKHLFVVPSEI